MKCRPTHPTRPQQSVMLQRGACGGRCGTAGPSGQALYLLVIDDQLHRVQCDTPTGNSDEADPCYSASHDRKLTTGSSGCLRLTRYRLGDADRASCRRSPRQRWYSAVAAQAPIQRDGAFSNRPRRGSLPLARPIVIADYGPGRPQSVLPICRQSRSCASVPARAAILVTHTMCAKRLHRLCSELSDDRQLLQVDPASFGSRRPVVLHPDPAVQAAINWRGRHGR